MYSENAYATVFGLYVQSSDAKTPLGRLGSGFGMLSEFDMFGSGKAGLLGLTGLRGPIGLDGVGVP